MAAFIPVVGNLISAASAKLVDTAEIWSITNGNAKTDLFRAVGSVCTVEPHTGKENEFSSQHANMEVHSTKTNFINNMERRLKSDSSIILSQQDHLISLITRYFDAIHPELLALHSRIDFCYGTRHIVAFRLSTSPAIAPTLKVNLLDLQLEVERIVKGYTTISTSLVNFIVTSALIIAAYNTSKELRSITSEIVKSITHEPVPPRTWVGFLLGY